MSDIRFNSWYHQSGTGGVVQDGSGNVGIGSTLPKARIDLGEDGTIRVGAGITLDAKSGIITATEFYGGGGNLTGIDATAVQTGTTKVQTEAKEVVTKISNVGIVSVTDAGMNVTGVVTATSYRGDGALLENTVKDRGWFAKTDVGIHTLTEVGIGTTNPTASLIVKGNSQVTGIVTFGELISSESFIKDSMVGLGTYSTTERDAGVGTYKGSMIYNYSDGTIQFWNGYGWNVLSMIPEVDSVSPTTFDGNTGATFTIFGKNFNSTTNVHFITNGGQTYAANTVVFVNASKLTATTGRDFTVAEEPLDVKVTNSDGMTSTKENVIDCGGVPAWTSPAASIGHWYEGETVSYGMTATDPDGGAITYGVQSGALPSGISLNTSTGVLTGTTPSVGSDTTSNFTLRATDVGGNTADRAFSMQVKNDTAFDRDPWGIGSVWGFYTFSGNYNDTGGSNNISNSGMSVGTGNQKSVAFGQCLQVSGANYGTMTNRGSGNFSIAFWIRNTGGRFDIVGDQGGAYKWSFGVYMQSATVVGFAADSNGGYPTVGFQSTLPGGASTGDGSWHHIACALHGSTGYVYYNGSLINQGTVPQWNNNPPNPMRLCALNSGGGTSNGQLDNVRIYNKGLSSSEVSTIYNAEAPR